MNVVSLFAFLASLLAATFSWFALRSTKSAAAPTTDPTLSDGLLRLREDVGAVPSTIRDEVERLRSAVADEITQSRTENSASADALRRSVNDSFATQSLANAETQRTAWERIQASVDRLAAVGQEGTEKVTKSFTGLSTRLGEDHRAARTEQLAALRESREAQEESLAKARTEQLSAVAQARTEQLDALTASRRTLDERFEALTGALRADQETARVALNESVAQMRRSNEEKLEQMRATVQEKLDATLGERFDASFKRVTEHLENVHKGLGEMQNLAAGVGSLQRTLTNVKTRGVWAELQLEVLLSDILTPDQFERQCRIQPGSLEMADFAIKMPGGEDGTPVRLAIDSKFPMDAYERLCDAYETGDAEQIKLATRHLEERVRAEAASIGRKYVAPPFTTDFAVLYLPTEGLFAEIARRPALVHDLRSQHRVIIAGPTTLTALLGSLSMGFRTLAIAKRSSEAWKVLGQVKSEFEKSGAVWEKVVKQLETTTGTARSAGVRYRAVVRTLQEVESVPVDDAMIEALETSFDDESPESQAVDAGEYPGHIVAETRVSDSLT